MSPVRIDSRVCIGMTPVPNECASRTSPIETARMPSRAGIRPRVVQPKPLLLLTVVCLCNVRAPTSSEKRDDR